MCLNPVDGAISSATIYDLTSPRVFISYKINSLFISLLVNPGYVKKTFFAANLKDIQNTNTLILFSVLVLLVRLATI